MRPASADSNSTHRAAQKSSTARDGRPAPARAPDVSSAPQVPAAPAKPATNSTKTIREKLTATATPVHGELSDVTCWGSTLKKLHSGTQAGSLLP